MPIKVKTDLEFGQVFYLKSDPEQFEHSLVGVVIVPGPNLRFKLSYMGDEIEVWDFECCSEPDELKILKSREQSDE